MNRVDPDERLCNTPCCVTAVVSALGYSEAIHQFMSSGNWAPKMDSTGYVTLTGANRFIRSNLNVKKRVDFKRGNRLLLKDLNLNGKAIVCVLGHYLYLDHETYYSFFDNEKDEVVSVWELK